MLRRLEAKPKNPVDAVVGTLAKCYAKWSFSPSTLEVFASSKALAEQGIAHTEVGGWDGQPRDDKTTLRITRSQKGGDLNRLALGLSKLQNVDLFINTEASSRAAFSVSHDGRRSIELDPQFLLGGETALFPSTGDFIRDSAPVLAHEIRHAKNSLRRQPWAFAGWGRGKLPDIDERSFGVISKALPQLASQVAEAYADAMPFDEADAFRLSVTLGLNSPQTAQVAWSAACGLAVASRIETTARLALAALAAGESPEFGHGRFVDLRFEGPRGNIRVEVPVADPGDRGRSGVDAKTVGEFTQQLQWTLNAAAARKTLFGFVLERLTQPEWRDEEGRKALKRVMAFRPVDSDPKAVAPTEKDLEARLLMNS